MKVENQEPKTENKNSKVEIQKREERHQRALRVASVHKKSEAELISILQDIEKHQDYLHYGTASLFKYCLNVLNLSDGTSYNLINVARKAIEVPALKQAIDAGELTVSKARKIVPVLTKTNQDAWIALAKTETSRTIEKAVASVNPQALIQETVRFKSEDRIELKVGISEALLDKLERVMDLESQRMRKSASREEALAAALELYLERNDPVRKAKRVVAKAETANKSEGPTARFAKPVTGQVRPQRWIRLKLPAALVHAIHMRDQHQCTHRDLQGKRCSNTRWLEVHHIQPKAFGGADTLENLTTLCASHHRHMHQLAILNKPKNMLLI